MEKSLMEQIESDLREHGERVVTLKQYHYFKKLSNMAFTLENVEENDNLVRLVRL